ncbi:MAG: hypothetical protein ACH350_04305 [Parachlamydiaceae bacterium]
MNPVQIDVPNIELMHNSSQTLSWGEIVVDTAKAAKGTCDPVSEGMGCCLGAICCVGAAVASAAAEADDNKHHGRRGHHHHRTHHGHCETRKEQERREREEMGCAFATGYCLGDCVIDSLSGLVGGVAGVIRATALTIFNRKPKREDPVFIYSRKEIDEIDLCDSCKCRC